MNLVISINELPAGGGANDQEWQQIQEVLET